LGRWRRQPRSVGARVRVEALEHEEGGEAEHNRPAGLDRHVDAMAGTEGRAEVGKRQRCQDRRHSERRDDRQLVGAAQLGHDHLMPPTSATILCLRCVAGSADAPEPAKPRGRFSPWADSVRPGYPARCG